jgi:hypothetical protein
LLDGAFTIAARGEFDTLPRRMRRAFDQMAKVVTGWTYAARRAANEQKPWCCETLLTWAGHVADTEVDLSLLAER